MISGEMLQDLRRLLEQWGIKPDDWYVTGEAAMVLHGYPVDFRPGQIDVLVYRDVWPWKREEEQVSLFPDKGTEAHAQFDQFVAKHATVPDFHPLPHVGISAEDRFEHSGWLPNEAGVRVLKPWAGILHRESIIGFYRKDHPVGLEAFDQAKFIRWKKFVEQTQAHARFINDEATMTVCERVLPIVQGAIDYFDQKAESVAPSNELKGTSVHPGKVTGLAQFWSNGADFRGKVAILTHMLPVQVTLVRHAIAIVTDQGGLLSHAATVAREYQIPTVIGTKTAAQQFKPGDLLEVDANFGTVRKIQ